MFRTLLRCHHGLPLIISTRNAGHSKWANIKHTKALKDSEKAKLFSKLGQRIKVTIFENNNNADPFTNPHLQQAIDVARKADVPIANIQNCIKQAQNDKSAAKPFDVVIKGPKGSYFLVSMLAASPQKAKNDLINVIKRLGFSLLDYPPYKMFEKKGRIIALPPSDLANPAEASVDHAIEAGAEEVQPTDDDNQSLEFMCDAMQLINAKKKLEEFKYTVLEADFDYIPRTPRVSLSDADLESIGKLLDKIEDHPDIIKVYDNIE